MPKKSKPNKPPEPFDPTATYVLARTVGSLSAGTRVVPSHQEGRSVVRTTNKVMIRRPRLPEKEDYITETCELSDIVKLRKRTR